MGKHSKKYRNIIFYYYISTINIILPEKISIQKLQTKNLMNHFFYGDFYFEGFLIKLSSRVRAG